MPTVVLPLITLIIGWVLSELGTWFKDHREEKARKLMRTEQKEDQQANFQRQTLLDLQEGLFQLARATGRIHHEDIMAYEQTGIWGKNRVSEEWNQKQHEAITRTNVLMVRVADDLVREQVETLRTLCTRIVVPKSPEEADQTFDEAVRLSAEINDHLGELLRSTY